jgi:hypothetical protein
MLVLGLVGLCLAVGQTVAMRAQNADPPPVSAEQYARWKMDLSNWGRWGKDDQIGALNLITPAKRRQAAALVRDGVSVSLAADADMVKAVDNPSPYEVTMQGIASDRISINYHGIAHTHLDSLAHINENGVFYNGYTGRCRRERAAFEELDSQREGRSLHSRRADRPAAAEGAALPRTGHPHHGRRSRGGGSAGGREGVIG